VQQHFPSLILSDDIPSDMQATQIMQGWKEHIPEIDVLVLACDKDSATLEIIENLTKAIHQKLARAKTIFAEQLEREKRWEQFLAKNRFKLIIASPGFESFKEAKRHCKSYPNRSECFLGDMPLIILSAAAFYAQSPKEKVALWNRIQALAVNKQGI
jgi:hypothetical protein